MRIRTILGALVALSIYLVPNICNATCSRSYNSTFALIQGQIFERYGCTDSLCHGATAQGGLDLRADVAYDNLVDVEAHTVANFALVLPGQRERSLLWINLAAATLPDMWRAPLRPMPSSPYPPISEEALEVIRLWINAGAPKDHVVAGTAELLDACLPPVEPAPIKPLPPPAPGDGVQLHMPPRPLPSNSENEVCYATYYDVRDQVPIEARNPAGTKFRYRLNRVRQAALSHHLFMTVYAGPRGPDDPIWGEFRCRGGTSDGEPCEPTDAAACGGMGGCATTPKASFGCDGFGPLSSGLNPEALSFTQETSSDIDLPPGVYAELPLQGMLIWNSHGINPTVTDGTLEAWLNFWFADADEQERVMHPFFDTDVRLDVNVPAFGTDELCNVHTFPRDTHLFEITSHAHKRMKRWRTFLGAWRCDGGPNNGHACSPLGYDLASADVCGGAACVSRGHLRVADCDLDGNVTVDEVIGAVNIALGTNSLASCDEADGNIDRTVTVDEVVKAVSAALNGVAIVEREADSSLFYVSLVYNDPVTLRFDPPLTFAAAASEDRAVTYCALYDNGFSNPNEVKRRSTSPLPPDPERDAGGPCDEATHCTAGRVGNACLGSGDAERNASCDTAAGSGDGFCDACPLLGGATTDDEMCILWGNSF